MARKTEEMPKGKSAIPYGPKCRFCGAPLQHIFADLGMSPLCESFLAADQLNQMEPFYPLLVYVCGSCLLVQVQEYVSPEEIFNEYAYYSSYSDSWVQHAKSYAQMVIDRFALDGQSQVIEIASNDGYLLQHFVERKIPVLGIEPAGNVAQVAVKKGIPTKVVFFGQDTAGDLVREGKQADLVIGNNVLAQVPNINDFVAGIKTVLKPDGLAACPSNTGERLLRVGWRPIHREEIRLSKTFRPYQPDQMLLMPVALQEWLPPDHLAYFISDVVDQLDLGEIESRYKQEERGYPPYHPVMMVKVLVYAYCVGVPSSRRIEKRLHEDIAFRVLAANNTPDFRTISDFRKDHLVALGGLFLKVLELCQQAGLAKLGHVSLDGTKMKANASKHKAMSYGRMKEKRVRLEAEVEELLKRAQQVDEEEDQRYGKDRRGDELPAELAFRESRLKKIREAQAALEEEAQAHGKEVPEDKSQRNFTDPDSRIMPGPGGKEFHQSYNCQAAVDSAHQVIVAADVTKQPSDHGWALPLVQQIENNTGSLPKEASADAGYYSAQAVAELYALGVDPFIPPDKTRHGTVLPPAPRGRIPGHLSPADRMRRKLRTQRGKRRYALRMGTVEPVFGQIKQARGFRQFLLRGLEKVRQEWRLICAGHNLLKLFAALRGSRCRQGAPAVA